MTRSQHHWIWFTQRAEEAAALEEVRGMGIAGAMPVTLRLESKGKNRRPKAVDVPVLDRTIFASGTVEDWHRLRAAKTLTGTHIPVGRREWARHVVPFIERAAQAHSDDLTRYRAGDMTQYDRGQSLRVILGPMEGQVVKFIAAVERAHDTFPKIRAEVDVMGQTVRVEFDPLHVKRA